MQEVLIRTARAVTEPSTAVTSYHNPSRESNMRNYQLFMTTVI